MNGSAPNFADLTFSSPMFIYTLWPPFIIMIPGPPAFSVQHWKAGRWTWGRGYKCICLEYLWSKAFVLFSVVHYRSKCIWHANCLVMHQALPLCKKIKGKGRGGRGRNWCIFWLHAVHCLQFAVNFTHALQPLTLNLILLCNSYSGMGDTCTLTTVTPGSSSVSLPSDGGSGPLEGK